MAPSGLAEAADANFVTHASWLQRRLPGMQVIDREDLVLIDSGLPCDTFNIICRARLKPGDATARTREAVHHFRQAGRPFSWWVGPADRPTDLGNLLVTVGLRPTESELAMSADLSQLAPAHVTPPGLRIQRVGTEPEVQVFARIIATNGRGPDPDVLRFYQMGTEGLLTGNCPLWLYVGYWNDEPVATAELTVGGGVVGLYGISTMVAYRRRGIGTAMTLRPLFDARDLGHDTAVLQAAPDGVAIYQRVGFRRFGEITEFKPT